MVRPLGRVPNARSSGSSGFAALEPAAAETPPRPAFHHAPTQRHAAADGEVAPVAPFAGVGTEVTDIHIFAAPDRLNESIFYPGPRPATGAELVECATLLKLCQGLNKRDFLVVHRGFCYRGHADEYSVDGLWYRLKRLPATSPRLETLPTRHPPSIYQSLMSRHITRGGLILVCGAPGSGKTHTAAALTVSRLRAFGGVAYTLEDPPEMALGGWHGRGVCHQAQVPADMPDGWSEAFRGVLRSQPAGSYPILLVGELREGAAVRACVRAAQNGFLVIATSFGSSIIDGLRSLIVLSTDGATQENPVGSYQDAIAGVLRAVVHQKLAENALHSMMLVSRNAGSTVAQIVRSGALENLSNPQMHQNNMMFQSKSTGGIDVFSILD